MAVAVMQEWAPTNDRTTTNYDAIGKKMGVDTDPPAGLLIHVAGFSHDGTFRIFEVWESREDAERFRVERLMPAVGEVMATGAGAPPVKEEMYDLHAVTPGP